jgi:kynureninase
MSADTEHLGLADMQVLDLADPLRAFREQFDLPEGIVYLDGNSLGALPRATKTRVAEAVCQEWGQGLIRSWNNAGWIDAPARIGGKIAGLIGAAPAEVIVADSTSVNIFKLLSAALAARPGRPVILSESGNFPTDLYVAQGVSRLHPGTALRAVDRHDVAGCITDKIAVVMLTHVHYKTGERFDMRAITEAAHAAGALMFWDLSHSVGAIEVDLNGANADMAVGCGYKYLNGGPGAPAFLFVAARHHATLASPLSGWMGHAAPFAFVDEYRPAPGMAQYLCGTPPILGMAALEAGVDLFLQADRAALFGKSARLCATLIDLAARHCPSLALATPRAAADRGSHVSFRHPQAYAIAQALIARGVVGDFRDPDILRFGLTPLYLGFEDVWHAVAALRTVLETREWDRDAYRQRLAVT